MNDGKMGCKPGLNQKQFVVFYYTCPKFAFQSPKAARFHWYPPREACIPTSSRLPETMAGGW